MSDTAWLLELCEVSGGLARLRYWAGGYWAMFALDAARFARREDAEQTCRWLVAAGYAPQGSEVREHAWIPLPHGFAADLALDREQPSPEAPTA